MADEWYTDETGFRRKRKKGSDSSSSKKAKAAKVVGAAKQTGKDAKTTFNHTWGGLKHLGDLFRKMDDKKGKVNEE